VPLILQRRKKVPLILQRRKKVPLILQRRNNRVIGIAEKEESANYVIDLAC